MRAALFFVLFISLGFSLHGAPVRIKDLANFDGVRGNDLIGYGLVVGLNGTGDGMRNSPFTEETLVSTLERLGVNVSEDTLRSSNVAAVIVTANLPEFSRAGNRIDVGVSAIGDAKSLLGGTLIMTPLKAADGNIYAVAQGSVISGGVSATGESARVTEGVPTSGRIPGGARVEREVSFDFGEVEDIRISLRNADFSTAIGIEDALNGHFNQYVATASDSGTVVLDYRRLGDVNPARIIGQIENIMVRPDSRARVVIDHRSGTIVMGEFVRISRVAVSQGALALKVSDISEVHQPNPFSTGSAVVVPRSFSEIEHQPGIGFAEVGNTTSLGDLVSGLNSLGVRPREMIDILKSIHTLGALHGELIIE